MSFRDGAMRDARGQNYSTAVRGVLLVLPCLIFHAFGHLISAYEEFDVIAFVYRSCRAASLPAMAFSAVDTFDEYRCRRRLLDILT